MARTLLPAQRGPAQHRLPGSSPPCRSSRSSPGAVRSPARVAGELLEGAAKPIGGDAEGTVRLADRDPTGRDTEPLDAATKPAAAPPPQ